MKAPHRGVMRLFHRKSVINSKNCILNVFFARNMQNPDLNRQKQQNLRLFTDYSTPQQAPAFFTFMSRVSDINSTRLTIDYYSGIVNDFVQSKKLGGILYANQKTPGGISIRSSDVQNPRAPYQLPILYILYVWSPLKRRLVSFIKEIRKSRVAFKKEIR